MTGVQTCALPISYAIVEVATVVGVPPGVPFDIEGVMAGLGERKCLLIFDNAEHLLDPVAEIADAVLDRTERTTLIVTSREPLGLADERVWRVRSLPLGTDAPALFCDRLGAGAPDDPNVREICRRLDGIPLAIELAAARARSLSVAEVLSHLDDRLHLLAGGRRANPRHATLQAALD